MRPRYQRQLAAIRKARGSATLSGTKTVKKEILGW